MTISKNTWDEMTSIAWNHRKNARILGKTKVGAAVLSKGKLFGDATLSTNLGLMIFTQKYQPYPQWYLQDIKN